MCSSVPVTDVSRVYKMTSLHKLQLRIRSRYDVTDQLTELHRVTELSLLARHQGHYLWRLKWSVNWAAMPSLCRLKFSGPTRCKYDILQLTSISNLTYFVFFPCPPIRVGHNW